MKKRKHVFISHHHRDDGEVSKFTSMLNRNGYEVRNSSIRAKPSNQDRLDKGLVKAETIRRLLRMKISWASSTIVIIGKETHKRPWVNWEIEHANKSGKPIVGVYARGGTESDIPDSLEKYATSIVNWNTKSIINAINGTSRFLDPSGAPRNPTHSSQNITC